MSHKNNNNKDNKPNPKSATNNQWTSNNVKEKTDTRKRQDGPGGN